MLYKKVIKINTHNYNYLNTYFLCLFFSFLYLFFNLIHLQNFDIFYHPNILNFFINDWSFIFLYHPDIKNIGLF